MITWVPDADFIVRAAVALRPENANTVIRVRDSRDAPRRDTVEWSFEDAGSDQYQRILSFTRDGRGARRARHVRRVLGFAREENAQDLYARMEEFLAH